MAESPILRDGETHTVHGSRPYEVKNVGGAYSCSCPGWRNQSRHPNYRSCKHLVEYRGARDEAMRIFPGGRDGMPSTVSSLLLPHFPTRHVGSPSPRPVTSEGERLARGMFDAARNPPPGGRALRHGPGLTIGVTAKTKVGTAAPAPKNNAWTKLLDDEHPLAEPLPAPAPVNASVPPAPADEPEWKNHGPVDPAASLPLAPTRTAFRGVLLAESWDGVQDIRGWHMSEKLDGVRAYWDGSQFLSRNGNGFAVPDWYRDRMPKNVHLDGEFWIGRGRFQETSGFVRRGDRGEYWRDISYMVFDVPSVEGGFEARLAAIAKEFTLPAHCAVLPQAPCPDVATLRRFLAAVEEQGGEGVMLRQPGSRYVRTRSSSLLKVKTFFDSEARVTGTTAGKGRHIGAVGALEVRIDTTVTLKAGKKTCTLRAGTEFEVGTGLDDGQRRAGAIAIGSTITFQFQELSKDGIPRFPSLLGVRNYE